MNPITVIIWVCVGIFIVTAILTLLHISGFRQLPNPEHGKILFKALILEIVIVAVAAFGKMLIPSWNNELVNPKAGININQGIEEGLKVNATIGGIVQPPASQKIKQALVKANNNENKLVFETEKGEDCREITLLDASTIPPTSKIQKICN